jgi:glycosyltransferase involved in cell wall biosynthesis
LGGKLIKNVSILSSAPLYPNKSGGYLRILNIAKLASMVTNASIFAVDEKVEYHGQIEGINLCQSKKYKGALDKLIYQYNGLQSSNFAFRTPKEAFNNLERSLIQIEGPYFYNLLKKKKINNYILDEHNVYWEFFNFPSYSIKEKVYNKISCNRDKEIEVNAIKNATHTLVCSERDKTKILEEIPEAKEQISVIPNCVCFNEYDSYKKNHEKYEDGVIRILFMGSLIYGPNIDAVTLICTKIAPHFKNDIKFIIIGMNPPSLNYPENVELLGYVDDIKSYLLNSDICISPLRYGSGTRFKILEYMAMGKPVISTSKGAEGIDYTNGTNIIIEDNIDEYPRIISEIIENKKMLFSIGKSAEVLVHRKYDWVIYKDELQKVYEYASKN